MRMTRPCSPVAPWRRSPAIKARRNGQSSRPATRGKVKAAWLADAIARADSKRKALAAEDAKGAEKDKKKASKPISQTSARKIADIKGADRTSKSEDVVESRKQQILRELCELCG